MIGQRYFIFAVVLSLICGSAQAKTQIDTSAARATLEALSNEALTRDEALKVADLPGNQAIVRKLNEMSRMVGLKAPLTRDDFADDLITAAKSPTADDPFKFARVREGGAKTLALLDRIAKDPKDFDEWIAARVARFSPPGIDAPVTGYLIAGGQATGFAFGEPKFYLDISQFGDDFNGARVILSHELYHAVQAVVQEKVAKGVQFDFDDAAYQALPAGVARDCYATRALFGQLVTEGTATYVGDPALLTGNEDYSKLERERDRDKLRPIGPDAMLGQRTLLEMSVRTVTGSNPLPEDDVYATDFYGKAPLYDIGYLMAKVIALHDGDAALGEMIAHPGDTFVRRYMDLAAQPNANLPKLGAQTEFWARREGCLK